MRLSDGALTEVDWNAFEAWLAKPGHADLLQDANMLWQAAGAIDDWPQVIALRARALTQFRASN